MSRKATNNMDIQQMIDRQNHGAQFEYVIQWQFEEDNLPAPSSETAPDMMAGLMKVMALAQVPKTLTHLSITRRLK